MGTDQLNISKIEIFRQCNCAQSEHHYKYCSSTSTQTMESNARSERRRCSSDEFEAFQTHSNGNNIETAVSSSDKEKSFRESFRM